MTGIFAAERLGGSGLAEDRQSIAGQVVAQGGGVIMVYIGVDTAIILKIVDAAMRLRVSLDGETQGPDIAQLEERGSLGCQRCDPTQHQGRERQAGVQSLSLGVEGDAG